MPRKRTLKYGFFTNDKLAELDFPIRMLFAGLWTIADREGKLEDRPKKIHALLFPYDHDLRIDQFLDALQDAQFLRRYAIGDASYIKILNFNDHQNPHQNEAESIIPEPKTQKHGASTVQAPDKHGESMPCSLYLGNIKKEKNIKKRKKNPSVKFEQFYEAYPVHKDRQRAWITFNKINPDDELFAEMLKAIENQKQEYKLKNPDIGYKFFKYAAPWLNGRCWTDEVDLSQPKKTYRYGKCKRCGKEKTSTMDYCDDCENIINPPRSKQQRTNAQEQLKNILPKVVHA